MIHIRAETPADYADIAAINARAFGNRSTEPVVVALLRQRRAFDAELSLVAERDGRVVGHALFSPQTIRLMGQSVEAVCLGPIAVDPPYHGEGIGGALIGAGHDLARSKGYAISFLLGHPTYYPRFGYKTRAFGESSIGVMVAGSPPNEVESRPLTENDVPALIALWEREEANVDMSVFPGAELLDWLPTIPSFAASVWTQGGEVIGYTRGPKDEPRKHRMFLARDAESAWAIVRKIGTGTEHVLPLHPHSASSAAFGAASASAWEAAMVCPLVPSVFDEYYAQVQAGARPPGRPIWPVAFDGD